MINKGDFLISTPESLGDYYFNRSIVILTEVNKDEIVGFIVNKELDYTPVSYTHLTLPTTPYV